MKFDLWKWVKFRPQNIDTDGNPNQTTIPTPKKYKAMIDGNGFPIPAFHPLGGWQPIPPLPKPAMGSKLDGGIIPVPASYPHPILAMGGNIAPNSQGVQPSTVKPQMPRSSDNLLAAGAIVGRTGIAPPSSPSTALLGSMKGVGPYSAVAPTAPLSYGLPSPQVNVKQLYAGDSSVMPYPAEKSTL